MEERLPPRPLLSLLLRLLSRHYVQDIDDALREAGFGDIRPSHANVIPFIPPGGIQVSELARLARMRKQSAAEAIRQLERAGYVERRPDPGDRRAQLVFLTSRGQEVGPTAVAAGRRVEERWAVLTSPDEVEALRAALRDMLIRISAAPDTGNDATES